MLPRRDESESSNYQIIAKPVLVRLDRPSLGEIGLWWVAASAEGEAN